MSDVNRIAPNVRMVGGLGRPVHKKAEGAEEQATKHNPQTNFKSADDVLGFMGASFVAPAKTNETEAKTGTRKIEVSKYVTPEQAKRIAGFVQEFEGAVAAGLVELDKEFGHMPEAQNMSESAKNTIAAGAYEILNQ